jgi:hypothetical protein
MQTSRIKTFSPLVFVLFRQILGINNPDRAVLVQRVLQSLPVAASANFTVFPQGDETDKEVVAIFVAWLLMSKKMISLHHFLHVALAGC